MDMKVCWVAVLLLTIIQPCTGSKNKTDADGAMSGYKTYPNCLKVYKPVLPITFSWNTTDGQSTDMFVNRIHIANCEYKFNQAFLYKEEYVGDYEANIDMDGTCTFIIRRLLKEETLFMIISTTAGLSKVMMNNDVLYSNPSQACARVERGEHAGQNSALLLLVMVPISSVIVLVLICAIGLCIYIRRNILMRGLKYICLNSLA